MGEGCVARRKLFHHGIKEGEWGRTSLISEEEMIASVNKEKAGFRYQVSLTPGLQTFFQKQSLFS